MGAVVVEHAPVDDDVQGAVEVAVAAAVEAVAGDPAGGGFHWADAGEGGEGGFGAEPAGWDQARAGVRR